MAEKSSKKRLLKKVILAIVVSLILVAIINMYVAKNVIPKLYKGGKILSSDFVLSQNEDLGHTFRKNLKGVLHPEFQVEVSTNSEGFRTFEFTSNKNTPRILLLGDSISFGVYLSHSDTLSGQLSRRFSELEHDVEIFNLGIPIYSIPAKVTALEIYGKKLEPDVLILQTKPSDIFPTPVIGMPEWVQKLPLITWMYYRYKKDKLRNMEPSPNKGLEKLQFLETFAKSQDIKVIVLHFPSLVDEVPSDIRNADLKNFTGRNWHTVNVYEILTEDGRSLVSYRVRPEDTIHPNKEAIKKVTDRVFPIVSECLFPKE